MTRLCYLYTNYWTSRSMEQELKVLGKFLYSHFLCFFDSKADLLTSVTTSAQGNPSGYGEKVAKSLLYLITRFFTNGLSTDVASFFPRQVLIAQGDELGASAREKLFSHVPHPLAQAVNKPSPCGFFCILVNRRFVNRLLWKDNTWALPVCPVPRCSRSFIWG